MLPYASLFYLMLLMAVLLPVTVAGLLGRANWRWTVAATFIMLGVQYANELQITPHVQVPELVALILFGFYHWGLQRLGLRIQKAKQKSWWLIPAAVLPLVLAKLEPGWLGGLHFGFVGISYITFRVLDILWAISDGTLKEVGALDFIVYAFFFPTISSGPIDRFKRFKTEWRRPRNRADFLDDLEVAIPHIIRGLLYKNIIAALIENLILKDCESTPGLFATWEYAWAYSFYLFFDFAGYTAFAIGVGCWFGIRSPENFALPWASSNIREFWARWHISLSTWFRDHIYTRFLMLALKRKWFARVETASALGYFISFGIMGFWHGFVWHYIIYGLYHASLMVGYDTFLSWKKKRPTRCKSRAWNITARLITLHAVVFGLWIFSGRGHIPTPVGKSGTTAEIKHD